jgi:hypothetical protein
MLLEEEDVKLLAKIDEIIRGAEVKMNMDLAQLGGMGDSGTAVAAGIDGRPQMDDNAGYATKLLRVTAYMFDNAAVWPGTCKGGEVDRSSTAY